MAGDYSQAVIGNICRPTAFEPSSPPLCRNRSGLMTHVQDNVFFFGQKEVGVEALGQDKVVTSKYATSCIIVFVHDGVKVCYAHLDDASSIGEFFDIVRVELGTIQGVYALGAMIPSTPPKGEDHSVENAHAFNQQLQGLQCAEGAKRQLLLLEANPRRHFYSFNLQRCEAVEEELLPGTNWWGPDFGERSAYSMLGRGLYCLTTLPPAQRRWAAPLSRCAPHFEQLLQPGLNEQRLLQAYSTTPEDEPPEFVPSLKAAARFIVNGC